MFWFCVVAALGFLDDSLPAWKIEAYHPSPAPSSLYHPPPSPPPHFPKSGISERLTHIGIADQMRDLKCTWGHLKICSWRRIWNGWKTGTSGMPDGHSGVHRLIFPADTQRSLTCGFKTKKKTPKNSIIGWISGDGQNVQLKLGVDVRGLCRKRRMEVVAGN